MLTIQFGQCGNQLGHSLFQHLLTDIETKDIGVSEIENQVYKDESFEKWFTSGKNDSKPVARAILIDTEHKVVNKICSNPKDRWIYNSENLICQAGGGSANNWAYGSLVKGPQLKDKILEITRKEIEKTDRFNGILLLLSSAGGTGSGVGSFTADLLRNEFPTKSIISSIVLPFTSGEVGVQNYNTMLTLARLNETVDLNLIFQNEQIHKICTNILNKTETKLIDMNDIISRNLCATFQPTLSCFDDNANYLTSTIACHPSYKIATIKSTPYISPSLRQYESFFSWKIYVQHLRQTLRVSSQTNTESKNPSYSSSAKLNHPCYKSVSNLLIPRGDDTRSISYSDFDKKDLYVDWVLPCDRFTFRSQPRRLLNQEKFLTLVTNNSQIHETLDCIVNKAWNAYIHSAFLHQYVKFGLDNDDFLRAFTKVENLIKDYKNL